MMPARTRSPLDRLVATEHEILKRTAEDAALEILARAVQRDRSMRFSLVPVIRLAEEARRLNAEVVVTYDPDMPNGVGINVRPRYLPEFLRAADQ